LQHSYGSASQGLWLHSTSAKEMQSVFDQIVLQVSLQSFVGGLFCFFLSSGFCTCVL
jgi:hypothetical protein